MNTWAQYQIKYWISNPVLYIWSWYWSILLFPYHFIQWAMDITISYIHRSLYYSRKSSLPPPDCCDYRRSNSCPDYDSLSPALLPPPAKKQLSTKNILNTEMIEFKAKLKCMSLIQLINYYEYVFMTERKQTLSKLDEKALRRILLSAIDRYGTSNVLRDQIILNAKGYIYLSPLNLGNPIYLETPDPNFSLQRIWSRRPLLDYFLSKHSLH